MSVAHAVGNAPRFFKPVAWLCLALAGPLHANSGNVDGLIDKYESLLLFRSTDYESSDAAKAVFEDSLLTQFRRAVRDAGSFPFERRGELAYFVSELGGDTEETDEERETREAANREFHALFNGVLPRLAFAYHTPELPTRQTRTTRTHLSCSFASRFLTTATVGGSPRMRGFPITRAMQARTPYRRAWSELRVIFQKSPCGWADTSRASS